MDARMLTNMSENVSDNKTINMIVGTALTLGTMGLGGAAIVGMLLRPRSDGDFFSNKTLDKAGKATILAKMIWDIADPFVRRFAKKIKDPKKAGYAESARYAVDQLFDVVANFLNKNVVRDLFSAEGD